MTFTSPLPDVEIPDVALTEYVLERAGEFGDKPALVDGPSGRTLTYRQLEAGIRALAGGLVARGFAKGEVVAVMAPNIPEYAIVFHGVAMAGGIVTTINPTYTEREVHHQLVDSRATMLVTVAPFLETASKAVVGTDVEAVYLIGEVPAGADALPVTDLFGEPLAQQVPVSADDVVTLPYSSGTTGVNKGVMLTHHNLVANIAQGIEVLGFGDDERFVGVLPFFHIYAMQVVMNFGARMGATVVTMPRFDLVQFLELNAELRASRAFVAPPIIVALAKHPVVENYDLSSLRTILSAAAPLSAELAIEAGNRLGCEVSQGYGMTELSPVSHATPLGQCRPGSVGVTVSNTETRIVDPASGNDLGVGEDGEIWVRGPQVMKGYLNNQAATDATLLPDGWLRTGDIGHVEDDGHLFIVDRLKELIKVSGFQVAPAELEALLLTHPAIADAAVIGRANERTGEVPVAFVVVRDGQALSKEDVEAFVSGQVAHYKQLGDVVFVEAIPKSASGKILRRMLRDDAPAAQS